LIINTCYGVTDFLDLCINLAETRNDQGLAGPVFRHLVIWTLIGHYDFVIRHSPRQIEVCPPASDQKMGRSESDVRPPAASPQKPRLASPAFL
jgi:hypothetical protein